MKLPFFRRSKTYHPETSGGVNEPTRVVPEPHQGGYTIRKVFSRSNWENRRSFYTHTQETHPVTPVPPTLRKTAGKDDTPTGDIFEETEDSP